MEILLSMNKHNVADCRFIWGDVQCEITPLIRLSLIEIREDTQVQFQAELVKIYCLLVLLWDSALAMSSHS